MLTAKRARELVEETKNADYYVDEILKRIEEEAKKGKEFIKCNGDFWVNGGYAKTEKYREACGKLEKLGFDVQFYYKESQFVDMYTIIKW